MLARFLGLAPDGTPLYGYSTCEFPRIGRYLMHFVGLAEDGVPVYALGCCPEGSSGSSGESSGFSGSSSGSSGDPFPAFTWSSGTWGGATWSIINGRFIRMDFEDSANCGGTSTSVQGGNATTNFYLSVPARLTVHMNGRVERNIPGFDTADVVVDGDILNPIAAGGSTGWGGQTRAQDCVMIDTSTSGSIDLAPGYHSIWVRCDTVDEFFHVGAYWEFHFTWEPL
jgi:hypothetical protein